MNINKNNKIGIWGYGVVGKSALKHLVKLGCQQIEIFDNRELTELEKQELEKIHPNTKINKDLENFLETNQHIIASPGIDISEYINKYPTKFISEVDQFFAHWKKQIIAVTGSVGKTSTVTLLEQILNKQNIKTIAGGNLGTPLFEILEHQETHACVLIELSSFQLQDTKHCIPDIAIWTNFYPNHIDRHKTIESYFEAKLQIIKNQKPEQKSIVPFCLKDKITKTPELENRSFIYFQAKPLTTQEIQTIKIHETIYFIKNENIIKHDKKGQKLITTLPCLPNISYTENWLIILAVCDLLNINIDNIPDSLSIPEDRLELVKEINNILFYNDSKSTVTQSTIKAVEQISKLNKPIHLFLGGLSKGASRSEIFEKLSNIKHIYCFGLEAESLYKNSQAAINKFRATQHTTLSQAFNLCIKQAAPYEIILFSPSGSSFDQFKDYHDRGNYFKKLVSKYSDTL